MKGGGNFDVMEGQPQRTQEHNADPLVSISEVARIRTYNRIEQNKGHKGSLPLCLFVSFVIQGLRPAQAHENRSELQDNGSGPGGQD